MVEIQKTVTACLLLLAGVVGARLTAPAQVPAAVDTALTRPDTLAPRPDTSRAAAAAESPSGIDTLVTYNASDSVVYSISSKIMYLYGKGDIRYRELGLKAEQIDINWTTSILNAQGVPDTADTAGKGYRGPPELNDGGEVYKGSKIFYNFKTKKGKITLGESVIEKGFYYGKDIKKIAVDELFVEDGRFTTCDLEHPHYYFASPTMKVTVRDNVVARPVYLYVADVPVFALPFGIFPNERGRRSGIIAPAYGESGRGRYLTHLGYYWAVSDYMDLALRSDLYSRGSLVLYADFRYALRYLLNGTLSGSYANTVSGEPGDPSYNSNKLFNLHLTHNQEFNPTTRLVVDFTLTSNTYYQQTSNNLNDLLAQNVVSNATLYKSWEGTPNSMTFNIHRDQIIGGVAAGGVSEVLPSISFNRSQSFPFRSGTKTAGSASLKWFELIGYTYSGQFLSTRNKSLQPDSTFHTDRGLGVMHQLTLNAAPKAGYFTVSPFFDYTEKWYGRRTRKDLNQTDGSIISSEERGLYAVRYFDLGISASTKMYGIVQPGIFGIKGIRHQFIPSLTYTYQPDFSRPRWGYYASYRDTAGNEVPYGLYDSEVFGGAPGEERQALSLRLGNVFEMKTASRDSAGQENKFTLLNLDVGTSYNFARDSLKFDPVSVGYRTAIGRYLNIGGSSTFNLYKFEPYPNQPAIGRRVNKFLLSEGQLAQMTGFSISVSTSLSGEKKETKSGPVLSEADSLRRAGQGRFVNLFEEAAPDFSIPWSLQLSWNFSQSQPDPRVITRTSGIAASLGFNLTENWKINASTNYDIINKMVAAPQITVYRDLHCWEMNFSWVPTGQYRNFQLEIRLKQPMLRDVKVTKQRSAREIF